QAPIARGAIVDLQLIRAFVDRHVQLVLAGIDPGAHGAILAHLLRPFLVMRTLGSFNHPGPMKSRSRSCSAAALVARERAIRRPATCSGYAPGAGHSSRNARTIPIRANTRSEHSERIEAWPPFETPPSAAPQGEVLSQSRREVHAIACRGPMNTGPAIVGHRSRGHDARRAGRRKRDYQITRRHPRGRAAQ